MITTINTELTAEKVSGAVCAILEVLGKPNTSVQQQALEAFHIGDAPTIKRLSLLHLTDNYLKCLGYLVSAPKLTPNTDTILSESARSAAEHLKDKALSKLGTDLEKALM